jgi:hypothetical protein
LQNGVCGKKIGRYNGSIKKNFCENTGWLKGHLAKKQQVNGRKAKTPLQRCISEAFGILKIHSYIRGQKKTAGYLKD